LFSIPRIVSAVRKSDGRFKDLGLPQRFINTFENAIYEAGYAQSSGVLSIDLVPEDSPECRGEPFAIVEAKTRHE
jgi:hypothetical protein